MKKRAKKNFQKLNDQLFESADNANKFANILMPVNAQLGNISYVLCAIVGGVLAINRDRRADAGTAWPAS